MTEQEEIAAALRKIHEKKQAKSHVIPTASDLLSGKADIKPFGLNKWDKPAEDMKVALEKKEAFIQAQERKDIQAALHPKVQQKKAHPEPHKTATPKAKQAAPEPKAKATPEPKKAAAKPVKASPEPKKAAAPTKVAPEPKTKAAPEPKKASPEPQEAAKPEKASPKKEAQAVPEPKKAAAPVQAKAEAPNIKVPPAHRGLVQDVLNKQAAASDHIVSAALDDIKFPKKERDDE